MITDRSRFEIGGEIVDLNIQSILGNLEGRSMPGSSGDNRFFIGWSSGAGEHFSIGSGDAVNFFDTLSACQPVENGLPVIATTSIQGLYDLKRSPVSFEGIDIESRQTVVLADKDLVVFGEIGRIAGVNVVVPELSFDLTGKVKELSPVPGEVIENDRAASSGWYEQGFLGEVDVNELSEIARYCKEFDLYMMMAIYRNLTVAMPLSLENKETRAGLSRVEQHIKAADKIVIVDPTDPDYDETTELGIQDGWWRDGQVCLDVDVNGVDVVTAQKARGDRVIFTTTEVSDEGLGEPEHQLVKL